MAPIKNWSRVTKRNVPDSLMARTVRKWRHSTTGDTVSVEYQNPPGGRKRYDILYNGEAVSARSTLSDAEDSAINAMRANPDGL